MLCAVVGLMHEKQTQHSACFEKQYQIGDVILAATPGGTLMSRWGPKIHVKIVVVVVVVVFFFFLNPALYV